MHYPTKTVTSHPRRIHVFYVAYVDADLSTNYLRGYNFLFSLLHRGTLFSKYQCRFHVDISIEIMINHSTTR